MADTATSDALDPKIIIPAVVAVLAAAAAAGVALYGKWLDRQNAIEQRHAQAREKAYDYLLAAGDGVWNFIARNYVSEVDDDEGLPDEHREAVVEQASMLLQRGVDQLEAHTRSFEEIAPILGAYYKAIFNNAQGSSEEYERVRASIVDCRRRDTGLSKALKESQKVPWWKRREALRLAKERGKGIKQVLHDPVDGVTVVTGDGPTILALLEEQGRWASEMRMSVATSRRRLSHWKNEGLWEDVPSATTVENEQA